MRVTPEFGVTVSRYVPARIAHVPPFEAVVAQCWIVANEAPIVPGFVSLPLGDTYKAFAGTALYTMNAAVGLPPPGLGFVTVSRSVPMVAVSDASMATVSLLAFTYVVEWGLPFHSTVVDGTKLVPDTVTVNPPPPALVDAGLSAEIVGIGLSTINCAALEVPPPGDGFETVTSSVPVAFSAFAGMATVREVADTKVAGMVVPFQATLDDGRKFVPVTVRVRPFAPTFVEDGLIAEIVGDGFAVAKSAATDVPPPGLGLVTVMLADPAAAMLGAGTAALSCVEDTNVVVRLVPFHCVVEFETKLDPFTVRVNDDPPRSADAGDKEEMDGAGLLIVNDAAADVPPPGAGFTAETLAVPAVATSAAVTAAVSCVADTNVVARPAPFHCTVEVEMKLVPFTVSENAPPPAVADDGEREATAGDGFDGAEALPPPPLPPQLAIAIPMPMTAAQTEICPRIFVRIFYPEAC